MENVTAPIPSKAKIARPRAIQTNKPLSDALKEELNVREVGKRPLGDPSNDDDGFVVPLKPSPPPKKQKCVVKVKAPPRSTESKIPPADRVEAYKKKGCKSLTVVHGRLHCAACRSGIHNKKDSIDKHLATPKHAESLCREEREGQRDAARVEFIKM